MKRGFLLFSLSLFSVIIFAQSAVYVCGHFRRARPNTVAALKASGFTTAILFNVHVEANGDLSTDLGGEAGGYICQNGQYVFGKVQPNYVNDVNALLEGTTSIRRIEHCIGGWGNSSYDNVKALVNANGTGENTNLYRNFKALKEALPCVEAINNDQEQCYDVATAVAFHKMLFDVGFKTTVAPYTQKTYWTNFVSQLNAARAGAVDRIYIQCYDGGASNNPADWYLNTDIPIWSGQLIYEGNDAQKKTKFENWKINSRTEGGFYWNYNDNNYNLAANAKIINDVFRPLAPCVTVYEQENYSGKSAGFETAKYALRDIQLQRFEANSIRSVKVHEGFIITLYSGDAQSGASATIDTDAPTLADLRPATVSSWEVTANSDLSLSGKTVYLKNRKSRLYLTLESENNDEGVAVVQRAFSGERLQQWTFTASNGAYRIINAQTRRVLQIRNASTDENAVYEQAANKLSANQKYAVVHNDVSGTFRIIAFHSAKYMAASDTHTINNYPAVVQTGNTDGEAIEWEIEDTASGIENMKTGSEISVYAVNGNLTVENLKAGGKIEIYDTTGRKITDFQSSIFDYQLKIDISALPQGVYLVKIGNYKGKFIKEH
jgi:hypothetical protein